MRILFFITIILSIAFRPLMPMIDYALNYDKIVNELCEYKAKPEILCNGFCYVKKEVTQSNKNQSENRFVKNSVKVLEAIIPQKQSISQQEKIKSSPNQSIDYYQDKNSFLIETSIFHPPIV